MIKRLFAACAVVMGLAASLTGCAWTGWLGGTASDGPTLTPVPSPAYSECAWQWATQDLPEITAQLAAAADRAGIAVSEARAYAFGENCLNPQGQVAYFATMETDFDLTLPVDDLSDREAVGDRAADVLALLLDQFPLDSTPGPQPGRIRLTFASASDQWVLTLRWEQAADAVAHDWRGSALLQALEVDE